MDREKFDAWCNTQGITFYREALYYHIVSTFPADKQSDDHEWLKAWNQLRKEIVSQ